MTRRMGYSYSETCLISFAFMKRDKPLVDVKISSEGLIKASRSNSWFAFRISETGGSVSFKNV